MDQVKWKKPSNPDGVTIWYHGGLICTAQTLKENVNVTFAKGATMEGSDGLFNARLDAKVSRAIDIYEDDELDDAAFTSSFAPPCASTNRPSQSLRSHQITV